MRLHEVVDYLPPREDLVKLARYVASMRRPARSELAMAGLVGAAVGAALALVFAPLSGRELREEVRSRLDARMNGEGIGSDA